MQPLRVNGSNNLSRTIFIFKKISNSTPKAYSNLYLHINRDINKLVVPSHNLTKTDRKVIKCGTLTSQNSMKLAQQETPKTVVKKKS